MRVTVAAGLAAFGLVACGTTVPGVQQGLSPSDGLAVAVPSAAPSTGPALVATDPGTGL